MTEPGFKRLWSTPRRCSRGGLLDPITPQQRYLRMQSLIRYRRRPDAYEPGQEQLTGELGRIESFRFITSTPRPDFYPMPDHLAQVLTRAVPLHFADLEPDQLGLALTGYAPTVSTTASELAARMHAGALQVDRAHAYAEALSRGYLAGLRSGISAVMIGMDLASGPDWTVAHPWPWREPGPQLVHPDWTPQDIARLARAALKRARKAEKLRQLSAKGAIGRG